MPVRRSPRLHESNASEADTSISSTASNLYPDLSGAAESGTDGEYVQDEDDDGNVTMVRSRRGRKKEANDRHRSRSRSKAPVEAELIADEDESFSQQWNRVAESWLQTLEEHWAMLKGGSLPHILFVVLTILLVVVGSALPRSTETDEVKLQRITSEIGRAVKSEFRGDETERVRTVLQYACRSLLQRGSRKPIIVLVAGSKTGIDKFISLVERISGEHLRLKTSTVLATSDLSRRDFESVVFGNLSSARILLLRDIDHLRGTSPLVLHSVSDPDTSPFKRSLIVVSTQLATQHGLASCEERVNEHLLNKWRSTELTEDQVYPILSRITALNVCLA